ncbi:MAG: ABC transporter ATP-binding protein [Saccharofermentanales bacterium]|jgi:simple sugar transport system ATP-binding protein|nr:ABC transporter ATP-binding protein [Eubacteriales bacterium]MDD3611781.1 ABC transporter ATP-binding protein [Eubacteriales bacterium]HHU04204.1 ABC transporter ATP-binding protein [Fastidiosipila sp.]
MAETIVELRNITKAFPGVIANDNISLEINKGEIFALLGENGAGKSTLMSILFGMYEPEEGEIYVRGEKVNLSSSKDATALNIGMVHQHFKLVSNYTITENIVLGDEPVKHVGPFSWVDLKGASEKIRALSLDYGLEVNPDDKIEDIPVSTQQRVEILKMLYRDAEILIFDEPTSVLTPQEIEYLLEIMEELRRSGKTIILITHKLEEIKQVADRCAILLRGKLVGVYDVAETSTQQMANLMVGKEIDFEIQKDEQKSGDIVLETNGITVFDDRGVKAVDDVSLQIREGEILAIAGVSGNGQTEIADAIAGLMDLTEGSIFLHGQEITKLSIKERINSGISYIPEDRQRDGLIMDLSLSSNLAIKTFDKKPFAKRGILQEKAFDKHAEQLIEEYDIRSGQGADTITRSMSGGNQQKAIVAREIELESDLMIFVQPTRGLDVGAINNIHRQILEEREKGKAILLVSLELDEVMALADTIAVIFRGKIIKTDQAAKLSKEEVGQYMMGVTQ